MLAAKNKSVGRKLYNWLCGIDDKPKPKITKEERDLIKKKMTSISEHPRARRVANIAAIVSAVVTAFLLGFFY